MVTRRTTRLNTSVYGGRRRRRRGRGIGDFFKGLIGKVPGFVKGLAEKGVAAGGDFLKDKAINLLKSKIGLGRRRRRTVGGRKMYAASRMMPAPQTAGRRRRKRPLKMGCGPVSDLLGMIGLGRRRRRPKKVGTGPISGLLSLVGLGRRRRRKRAVGKGPVSGLLSLIGLGRRRPRRTARSGVTKINFGSYGY